MFSFRTINSNTKVSNATTDLRLQKEAKEAANTAAYEKGLDFQRKKKWTEALDAFQKLLSEPLLKDIDEDEPLSLGDPSVMLKYLTLKNIGTIQEHRNNTEEALEYYLNAARIDDSDPSLWYHIGLQARESGNYSLARQSLERTLMIQPRHWLAFDQLIEVLYIIEDYVQMALQLDPNYSRGKKIISALEDQTLDITQDDVLAGKRSFDEISDTGISKKAIESRQKRRKTLEQVETETSIRTEHRNLGDLTWAQLAALLCKAYSDRTSTNDSRLPLHAPLEIEIKHRRRLTGDTIDLVSPAETPKGPTTTSQTTTPMEIVEPTSTLEGTEEAKKKEEGKEDSAAPPKARKGAKGKQPVNKRTSGRLRVTSDPSSESPVEAFLNHMIHFTFIEDETEANKSEDEESEETKGPHDVDRPTIPPLLEHKQVGKFMTEMSTLRVGVVWWTERFLEQFFSQNSGKYRWPLHFIKKIIELSNHLSHSVKHKKAPRYYLDVAEMLGDTNRWELSRSHVDQLMEAVASGPLDIEGEIEVDQPNSKDREGVRRFYARLYWMKAKAEKARNEPEEARYYLNQCRMILTGEAKLPETEGGNDAAVVWTFVRPGEKSPTKPSTTSLPEMSQNLSITLCHVDKPELRTISVPSIDSLLRPLEQSEEREEVKKLIAEAKWNKIIFLLGDQSKTIRIKLCSPNRQVQTDALQTVVALQRAYSALNNPIAAFEMADLILYGLWNVLSSEPRLNIDGEGQRPTASLILDQLHIIRLTVEEKNEDGLFTHTLKSNTCTSILKTLTQWINRSLTANSKKAADPSTSKYCMLFYLLLNRPEVCEIDGFKRQAKREERNYNYLFTTHKYLGAVQLCPKSQDYLRFIVQEMERIRNYAEENESDENEEENGNDMEELNAAGLNRELCQCYYCLFRIRDTTANEAHCPKESLANIQAKDATGKTKDPTLEMFKSNPLMLSYLLTFVTKHVDRLYKKVVEKISPIFDQPPDHLLYARSAVLQYIETGIFPENISKLPPPADADTSFDFVYPKIYNRNSLASKSSDTPTDLFKTSQNLLTGLFMEPNRSETWYQLGLTYRYIWDALLDSDTPENPVGSILEIENNNALPNSKVTPAQVKEMTDAFFKKANLSFNRAVELDDTKTEASLESSMLAYSHLRFLRADFNQQQLERKNNGATRDELHRAAIEWLKDYRVKVMDVVTNFMKLEKKSKPSDPSSWICPTFRGKCLEKLNRIDKGADLVNNNLRALRFYQRASQKEDEQAGGKTNEAEPHYRLHSKRLELLQDSAYDVELLSREEDLFNKNKDWNGMSGDQKRRELITDCILSLEQCQRLQRDYAHKHSYKLCLYYKKKGDVMKAVDEMEKLFHKKTGSGLSKVEGESTLDRGGKLRYYVERYLKLFVKLLEETENSQRLHEIAVKVKPDLKRYLSLYEPFLRTLRKEINTLMKFEAGERNVDKMSSLLRLAHLAYNEVRPTGKSKIGSVVDTPDNREATKNMLCDAYRMEKPDAKGEDLLMEAITYAEAKFKRPPGKRAKVSETPVAPTTIPPAAPAAPAAKPKSALATHNIMDDNIEIAYSKAIEDGKINGAIICATNTSGSFSYNLATGRRTLLSGEKKAQALDDILTLASATKIVTSIAALQCVEDGLLSLDGDLSKFAPELVNRQVLTGFTEDGAPVLQSSDRPITLEMLLTHSSGLTYDFMSPLIMKWRGQSDPLTQEGHVKRSVEDAFSYPLVFQPGTSWSYGPSLDWAGRIVKRATGKTLTKHLQSRVFGPLGITDASFYPVQPDHLSPRLVDLNPDDPDCVGRAVLGGGGDHVKRNKGDFGGHGLLMTAPDYLKILHSLLANDSKLLKPSTVDDLFRHHLSPDATIGHREALLGPLGPFIRIGVDPETPCGFSMGGLITFKDVEGWKNGLCGVGAVQASLKPFDGQAVASLKQTFRKDIYRKYNEWKERQ
ncbi:putative transesterase (LovD) [Planoprotostelium fungivorum]|uniref:Putative transesterase (LovD) n=1 Tax=Planoprotostelium fungivorum TaxID=1890364 RepID=A0A2P6NKB3_9EUKA|nr:putative transesterase (LovD) [Planoprotostelium fungivorum]